MARTFHQNFTSPNLSGFGIIYPQSQLLHTSFNTLQLCLSISPSTSFTFYHQLRTLLFIIRFPLHMSKSSQSILSYNQYDSATHPMSLYSSKQHHKPISPSFFPLSADAVYPLPSLAMSRYLTMIINDEVICARASRLYSSTQLKN